MKTRLLCTSQNRTDQLQVIVQNRLAGVSLRSPVFFEQYIDDDASRPKLVMRAEYLVKAEADSVWNDVKNANTNNWIVTPSVAIYSAMNDDNTLNALIERIDW